MPIETSSTRLEEKSKQENHPFEISELKILVRGLQPPIAVFKYGNNAKNVIIAIEYKGKQFLVGIHFNQSRRNFSDRRTNVRTEIGQQTARKGRWTFSVVALRQKRKLSRKY